MTDNNSRVPHAASWVENARAGIESLVSQTQQIFAEAQEKSRLPEYQNKLVVLTVQQAVDETVRLFNLPQNSFEWSAKPRRLVEAAQELVRNSRHLFKDQEDVYFLLALNLQRAEALLAPGTPLGSDLAIKQLKAVKKSVPLNLQNDPRAKEILSHVEIHLKKIYLRRGMADQYYQEQDDKLIAALFNKDFRSAWGQKIKSTLNDFVASYRETPQRFEAIKLKALYRDSLQFVDDRAVEYVTMRYRAKDGPVLIKGVIDFTELPSLLKSWSGEAQAKIALVQRVLAEQAQNPELSEDEVAEMTWNLKRMQANFSENPILELHKIRRELKVAAEKNLLLTATYDCYRQAHDQMLWKILDRTKLHRELSPEKSLPAWMLSRIRKEPLSDRELQSQNAKGDIWRSSAESFFEECFKDEACIAEGVKVIYESTVQQIQPWLEDQNSPEDGREQSIQNWSVSSDSLSTAEENFKNIKLLRDVHRLHRQKAGLMKGVWEIQELLASQGDNSSLKPFKKIFELDLERLEIQLQAEPASKTLEKLEVLRDKVSEHFFEAPVQGYLVGQLANDIFYHQTRAATDPAWKLGNGANEVKVLGATYDVEKIKSALGELEKVSQSKNSEEAAMALRTIAEYGLVGMEDDTQLMSTGIQAMIELLRDYPETNAAIAVSQNPLFQPLIRRMTANGEIPQYLKAGDLTDDDWREQFKALANHGVRNTPERKAIYVSLTFGALMTLGIVTKKIDPSKLLQLAYAADTVVNTLALSMILGGVGLDTVVPAIGYRHRAAKAAVTDIYRISDAQHDENVDNMIRTLAALPAIYFSWSGVARFGMQGFRAQASATGLSFYLHHNLSNAISPVKKPYSLSSAFGFVGAAHFPKFYLDLAKNRFFKWILVGTKSQNPQEIVAFVGAGLMINHTHQIADRLNGPHPLARPFPTFSSGFWYMEFWDRSQKRYLRPPPVLRLR